MSDTQTVSDKKLTPGQQRAKEATQLAAEKAAEDIKKTDELKAVKNARNAAEKEVDRLKSDILTMEEKRKSNTEASEEAIKTKSDELATATAKIKEYEEKESKRLEAQQQYAKLSIDPTLPTILSIGENGFEEIIDLKKDILNKDGTYKFLHTGAQKNS